jgi:threonine dehydrogenase-like Zn-dependent dehydrogenase
VTVTGTGPIGQTVIRWARAAGLIVAEVERQENFRIQVHFSKEA